VRMDESDLYRALVTYQVDRLKETYRDFLEQERYEELTQFFLEDVYATNNKEERDAGIKKVYDKFKEKVGRDIAENMKKVIELNDLTDRLDRKMVKKFQEMGIREAFDQDEYEEAYYLTDAYDDRVEQIRLIVSSLRYFHGLSRYRSIGLAMSLMRPYALLKGARALIDFLQEGYRAFRTVDDVSEFEAAIEKRELDRLNRIYSLGKRPPTIADLRKRAKEMGIKGAEKMTLRRMMKEMQKWT
jgi:hypothetical protein